MRDMGEPRDHDQRQQRIEIPRHKADEVLGKRREDPDRTDCHDITERDHHRRDEDRNQYQRLEVVPSGNVGPHHQEGEQGAERHGDRGHAAGNHNRRPERLPEIRVVKYERVGGEAEFRRRIEKWRGEKALIDDKRKRRRHSERGQPENQQAVHDNGHLSSSFRSPHHASPESR